MKLAEYFFNKGLYFEKVYLKEDTELIISNRQYSNKQFLWNDEEQNIDLKISSVGLSDTANPIYDIYSSKIGFNTLNTSTKPILLLPSYISIMLPTFKQFG